jgi:hypothetical protein
MSNIYENDWQRNDYTITVTKSFLEHLLNCLANQKFIGEPPPNGDAMAMEESEYRRGQREGQEAIDKAWRQGMFIMALDVKKNNEYYNKIESYVSFWNESIPEIMDNRDKDIQEFPNDPNIVFKWQHLVAQEIEMWIRLGCFSKSVVSDENETYEVGQIDSEDFDEIVKRRGFTPRIISFMVKTLRHVGIGNNLILTEKI